MKTKIKMKNNPDWNMSKAIREALETNPRASAAQTLETLKAQNPNLNEGSFKAGFYGMRGKISKVKRMARKADHAGVSNIDLDSIRLARKLIATVGLPNALALVKAVE